MLRGSSRNPIRRQLHSFGVCTFVITVEMHNNMNYKYHLHFLSYLLFGKTSKNSFMFYSNTHGTPNQAIPSYCKFRIAIVDLCRSCSSRMDDAPVRSLHPARPQTRPDRFARHGTARYSTAQHSTHKTFHVMSKTVAGGRMDSSNKRDISN
jgi:hypothetical protein